MEDPTTSCKGLGNTEAIDIMQVCVCECVCLLQLQDSINNILDHCWIPLKNTTGTRSMELLEGFNSPTMKDVVNVRTDTVE